MNRRKLKRLLLRGQHGVNALVLVPDCLLFWLVGDDCFTPAVLAADPQLLMLSLVMLVYLG